MDKELDDTFHPKLWFTFKRPENPSWLQTSDVETWSESCLSSVTIFLRKFHKYVDLDQTLHLKLSLLSAGNGDRKSALAGNQCYGDLV